MPYRCLTAFLVFFSFCVHAQITLRGTVTDPSGHPLAFVSVLVEGQVRKGVFTDIEGRFRLEGLERRPEALVFRYLGYATRRLEGTALTMPALRVVLEPADLDLPEATIVAGENPADRLIRMAIARRTENNPENLPSFRCKTYNKMVFDLVPHREALIRQRAGRDTSGQKAQKAEQEFRILEKAMQQHHAFLMESVTERSYRFPNLVQEKVLLNRVSGLPNAGIVALANSMQPFTFYGDYLRLLDKDYLNPISPGSPALYFFSLQDTLYQGPDTLWVISFHPRKGKVFHGLEGVLHLSSRNFGVQHVRTHPAVPNDNISLRIEQAYSYKMLEKDQGQWFPEQLLFELEFLRYPDPATGMRAAGLSYISEVDVGADIRLRDFDPETPVALEKNAYATADTLWAPWRGNTPLDEREQRTYRWLDSLGRTNRLDIFGSMLDLLNTGRWPLYRALSLDFNQLLRFNSFEGTRLGLGLTNGPAQPLRRPPLLEVGGYGGYGFRDKAWKYGGYSILRLSRGWQTQLRLDARHDLLEPGALHELPPATFVNRQLQAVRMDYLDEFAAALSSRLWKGATARVSLRRQDLRPAYDYAYLNPGGETESRFRIAEFTAFFRYAPSEQPRSFLGGELSSVQNLPVLELAFSRGLDGVLQGRYPYTRYVAALRQSFFIRRLGRMTYRLETGMVEGNAPLAKLFTLNQNGAGRFSLFAVRNAFQALPDTLILSDRFFTAFVTQDFGPILYRSKYSAPQLSIQQGVTLGDLAHPNKHLLVGFQTARQPLFESGLIIDHLVRINYVNFGYLGAGGGVYYRYGGLAEKNWEKNLSYRFTLRLEL